MMATANSSSPAIGRKKSLSNSTPTIADRTRATTTETDHPRTGDPSMNRPGKLNSTATTAVKKAPRVAMAPWAKFTTWVALKIMTNPIAGSA